MLESEYMHNIVQIKNSTNNISSLQKQYHKFLPCITIKYFNNSKFNVTKEDPEYLQKVLKFYNLSLWRKRIELAPKMKVLCGT